MLRIAICDDEKLFRENIKKYVLKYLSEKDISSEIDMFNSGKELLGLGTDLLGYNIIFLDIRWIGKLNSSPFTQKLELSIAKYILEVSVANL